MMVHLIHKSLKRGGPERCNALNGAHVDVGAVLDEVPQEVDVAVEDRAKQRRPAEQTLGIDRRARAAQVLHNLYVALIVASQVNSGVSDVGTHSGTRVSHLKRCHVQRRPVINVLGVDLASM